MSSNSGDSGNSLCITQYINFSIVSDLLENVEKCVGKHARKQTLIANYFENYSNFAKDHEKNVDNKMSTSLFPILRLLLPDCDHERGSYGIKKATLGRLYVRVLGIDGKSPDAKKLQGSDPTSQDFGEIVYKVMQPRTRKRSEITVFDVNKGLDLIAQHYQNGHSKKIDDVLTNFINVMTARDQKWLTRIILKHLGLGIRVTKVLEHVHPNAVEIYKHCSKLSAVCELQTTSEDVKEDALEVPIENPKISVKIFSAIMPMLLWRISLYDLKKALVKKEFFVETKMDGERFHLHREGTKYEYYSRRGKEYTDSFGMDFTCGSLTPYIHSLFTRDVESIILDGEMMVFNREEGNFYAKGDNFDVKHIRKDDPRLKVVFVVYDIIYLNGVTLTTKPYAERRRLLRKHVMEKDDALRIGKQEEIENFDHLLKCFNNAIDDAEEGIVIKEKGSYYHPGGRYKQDGWYKIKPDYVDGVVTDLDLLIIGGYHKKDKRSIDAYLLGVYANGPGEKGDPIFHSVGKVSARTLRHDERLQLNDELKAHWKPVEQEKMGRRGPYVAPQCLELHNAAPSVWIEPSKSIVLEIKAAELTETNTYRTTHALKFARILSIRRDKPWYDSCLLKEYEELCGQGVKGGVQKLAKRHISRDDAKKKPVKRQKVTQVTDVGILPDCGTKVSEILANLNFCVLSTRKNMPSIPEIRKMIMMHSGQIVESPDQSTFAIIAGDSSALRVRKYAEKKLYNIIKVEWLVRFFGDKKIPKKLPKFHPKDMISTTREMQEYFTKSFDEYGDSYEVPIEGGDLREFLDDMVIDVSERMLRRELIKCEKEIYAKDNGGRNIFRPFSIHFFGANQCQRTKLAEIIFKTRQGNVIDIDTPYVAINPLKLDQFRDQMINAIHKESQVISIEWIHACHTKGKILDMTDYLI